MNDEQKAAFEAFQKAMMGDNSQSQNPQNVNPMQVNNIPSQTDNYSQSQMQQFVNPQNQPNFNTYGGMFTGNYPTPEMMQQQAIAQQQALSQTAAAIQNPNNYFGFLNNAQSQQNTVQTPTEQKKSDEVKISDEVKAQLVAIQNAQVEKNPDSLAAEKAKEEREEKLKEMSWLDETLS